MSGEIKNDKEIRLTAAVYAKLQGVLEHVKATGHLPEINAPWAVIPMRLIIEERGTDLVLTPDEQLVYDAILRERKLPGGSVCLVDKE